MAVHALGEETFTSKKEVGNRARQILKDTKLNSKLEGKDLAFVLALLDLHPEAAAKKAEGVKAIFVRLNIGKVPGFEIQKTDGTFKDFSYRKCLGLKDKNGSLKKALRLAVVPQVLRAKNRFFNGHTDAEVVEYVTLPGGMKLGRIKYEPPADPVCPYTGERLTEKTCHVDHAPPNTFEKIMTDFLKKEGLKLEEVRVVDTKDPMKPRALVDRALEERWIVFHEERATLRVVSIKANLSIIPKENHGSQT
jgi:hypothetical protein